MYVEIHRFDTATTPKRADAALHRAKNGGRDGHRTAAEECAGSAPCRAAEFRIGL
jgi:hypothetical protein